MIGAKAVIVTIVKQSISRRACALMENEIVARALSGEFGLSSRVIESPLARAYCFWRQVGTCKIARARLMRKVAIIAMINCSINDIPVIRGRQPEVIRPLRTDDHYVHQWTVYDETMVEGMARTAAIFQLIGPGWNRGTMCEMFGRNIVHG